MKQQPSRLGSLFPLAAFFLTALPHLAHPASIMPSLTLHEAHTVITQSCLVLIPVGRIFSDPQEIGVIEIGASDIELDFQQGSELRGSAADTAPDQYSGYGILLKGHKGVTIRGLKASGYKCAIRATKADDLTLAGMDASDNYRSRLKSSPAQEDESDWLYGHENDHQEWLTRYGAAFYIEDSKRATVRDCKVWHGQNALGLDRVVLARIYDNDFSFNSGWGLALWRCSSNVISRNAFDFCVRGYSHAVYNRGQDSAGIFAFDQNCGNVFVENSVTHGGDGFFGFAGREAIGEAGDHPLNWYRRRGNSDNLLLRNDFSYAAAHGIENTFSFGNRYLGNRIVGNAICGVWAGYSRQTTIAGNEIRQNGELGYGLERGGVNIDHGGDNFILGNSFSENKCGVHLWGGANPGFEQKPWARANGYASTGSIIADNIFNRDELAFQFRGPGEVFVGTNRFQGVHREVQKEPGYELRNGPRIPAGLTNLPEVAIPGVKHPVGARPELQGRENIIMTEWGPWDHVDPIARLLSSSGGTNVYQVFKVPLEDLSFRIVGQNIVSRLNSDNQPLRIALSANGAGVHPFLLRIDRKNRRLAEFAGTLLSTTWKATFFNWSSESDPRTNLVAYRALARGSTAVSAVLSQLSLKYGMRGPSEMGLSESVTAAKLGRDHFGMIAQTKLPLPAGKWLFATDSDDGVRVSVDGRPVIENWSWHGPSHDTGELDLKTDRPVEITVEHFQIDGYAVLDFSLRAENSSGADSR